MWKIHNIIVCVTCTICGVLFFPLFLVFGILFALLTGLVIFYDLPLSVHVASIRLRIESLSSSAVNAFHNNSRTLLAHRRQLNSNGVINHHGLYHQSTKTSPNLISPYKLCKDQKLPDSFTMPLNNCNLHSTPLGVSKSEPPKNRKHFSDFENDRSKSSWCNEKVEDTFSPKSNVTRNVQTVAGPLLASSRFNTYISAELAADVNSLGFSSRVAQKGSIRDNITHQSKYSGVGVFPMVQFNSRSPKHSFSPRNNSVASKAVRVRIAPPDNSPFGGLENTILTGGPEGGDSMKSVLQVLKEMSRKRIHSQVDEEDDEKVKRQKKETCDENTPKTYLDGGLQNKRGRDDSPRSSEEVKRQRRLMSTSAAGSNEIMSSLSSSLSVKPPHLIKGTKRKANVVDWSRSTTPVSGKLQKVNTSPAQKNTPVSSPDKIDEERNVISDLTPNKSVDEMSELSTSKTPTPIVDNSSQFGEISNSNECVRIEAGQRRVLARSGDLKEVQVQDAKWQDVMTTVKGDPTTSASISVKKIKDPGRRLKDMLAAIDGSDDIEEDPSSMSPSVIAILKTAKVSSKNKKADLTSSAVSSKDGPQLVAKSPPSILKTPGIGETHKNVTFSEKVQVIASSQESTVVTETSNSSPQTCLTTATIVSNSINTSISSSSETSPLSFNSFSTFNNASSQSQKLTFSPSNPSTLVMASGTTTGIVQSSADSASSSVNQPASGVDSPNKYLLGGIVVSSNECQKALPIVSTEPIKPTGFTFSSNPTYESGIKPLSTQTQATSSTTPAVGMFEAKPSSTVNSISTPSFGFSTAAPVFSTANSLQSTPTNATLKTGSLNFNFGSSTGTSGALVSSSEKKLVAENTAKPHLGGFNFGKTNATQNSDNKPNVSFFGDLNSNAQQSGKPATTSFQQNSSFAVTSNSNNAPLVSNSMFSFGSNLSTPAISTASTNQPQSIFGSVTAQPTTESQKSLFGNSLISSTGELTKINSAVPSTTNTLQPPAFGAIVTTQSSFSSASTTSGPVSSSNLFGNNVQSPATCAPLAFGSNNLFSGSGSNKTDSFTPANAFQSSNVAAVSTAPSLFNHFTSTSTQNNAFGIAASTASNTFSTSAATSSGFGSQATPSSSSSLFMFGSASPSSSTVTTTQSNVFGGNMNSTTAPLSTAGSSFSSFSSGSGEGDKMKPSTFGNSPFQTPAFAFGSSAPAPASTSFAFGNSSNATATTTAPSLFSSPFKPSEQKQFNFNSAQPAMQNQSTPVFGFSQNNNSQPNAGATTNSTFQFGASSSMPQPAASGVFNFGAASNATNMPFGSGINPPAFNIGPGTSNAGSTMFNIGSGNSNARARSAGRPRRK